MYAYVVYEGGGGFAIFWELKPGTVLDQNNSKFFVYRKYSPSDEYQKLIELPITYNHFVDQTPRISYQERPLYKVELIVGNEVKDLAQDIVIDDTTDNDVRYRMIQNTMGIGLSRSFGNKIYILQRKTWGHKCLCRQNPRGLTAETTCKLCFGTGFLGGFYTPILTRAQKQNTYKIYKENLFTLEPQDMVYKIMNYPLCKEGDILINSVNERYTIVSIRPNYIQNKITSQLLQIRRVSGPTRLVYEVDVDLKQLQPDVLFQWRPL